MAILIPNLWQAGRFRHWAGGGGAECRQPDGTRGSRRPRGRRGYAGKMIIGFLFYFILLHVSMKKTIQDRDVA